MKGPYADKLKMTYILENRTIRVNAIIIAISIVLIIIFGILNPKFISISNFTSMGHQMAITAVIAFAMTSVILAKGIDLSVGSTLAVSGIIGASLYTSGVPPILVIISIILTGMLIGALNGFLITKVNISPFIATLGTMALGHGAALSLSNSSSISLNDKVITWAGSATIATIPVTIIITLVFLIVWWIILNRTLLGRYIYSIGGNAEASSASAINVKLIQFMTYVATGLSAGVASVLLIGRVQSAQPLGGQGLEFEVITAVIVGGTLLSGGVGGVVGTLFGVILVTIIRTGLSFFGAPQEITYMVTGLMVLISVILYNPESFKNLMRFTIRQRNNLISNTLTDGKLPSKILTLNGIGKKYASFQALNDINFSIKSGEVVALIGENGAGKSTLVKILSGVTMNSEGSIEIDGKKVEFENPNKSREAGIGVVHQHYSLVPELSITENLFLGREIKEGKFPFLSKRKMRNITRNRLKEFGIDLHPDIKVERLTVGQRQLIEVLKATLGNPWFLIMDEPTSSLSRNESEKLYNLIEKLKQRNVAILYISHKMDEIYRLCNRGIVLRDGNFIGDVKLPDTSEETIVNMMVGRNIENVFPYTKNIPGETVIEVKNISDGKLLKNASFSVREGEIVVLAGLMGSGRTEVLKCLFGINKIKSGSIKIYKTSMENIRPKKMFKEMRMAYIPEDRHAAGIIPTLSIKENLSLVWIQLKNRFGFISSVDEKDLALKTIKELNIRPPQLEKLVKFLSGGNQQKVVLGKWLLSNPKILLLDDPTRGVDVGAKAEIHRLISEYKKKGVAILMVSSELTEALNVADRIIVMNDGKTVAELKHGATEEEVMNYMLEINEKQTKEVLNI